MVDVVRVTHSHCLLLIAHSSFSCFYELWLLFVLRNRFVIMKRLKKMKRKLIEIPDIEEENRENPWKIRI